MESFGFVAFSWPGPPSHFRVITADSPREIGARAVFKASTEKIFHGVNPCEIAARGVFKVLTGEVISRGEPLEITARAVFKVSTEKIFHGANPSPVKVWRGLS